nr:PREDICTED: uncharacterized protein LOC108194853 [Daucus carota subsp. sativus]
MDRRRGVRGVRIRGERSLGWCKIRLASLNVGTLTGKFLELVDVLRKKKVDVACIQETRWKGEKTKEANGFELWYSGLVNSRNGVGILLSTKLKDNVVEIKRYGDRIMYIRLAVGTVIGTVICVYAPYVGLEDIESMAFWGCLDDLVRGIPNDQLLFVGGDFNGHIGASVDGYQGIHGGFGYGVRNEHGSTLLDFATAHDLVIVNSCFRKSDNNLITFRSGGHATQIDYLLIRSRDFRFCSDCQSSRGASESCSTTNSLAKSLAYQDMYRRLSTKEGVNEIFKLAKARNKRRQDICAVRYIKDESDRVLLHDGDITARWGRYFSELFNAARGRGIVCDQAIVHVPDNDVGASQDITVAEVRAALCMMGKGKTVGLDEIPIEVWQCLAEQGVRWLTALFNVIFRTSRMPREWRLSVVVPIYKNKGDVQSCSNYRGIKLLSHTMKLWERVIESRIRRIVTRQRCLSPNFALSSHKTINFSQLEVAAVSFI